MSVQPRICSAFCVLLWGRLHTEQPKLSANIQLVELLMYVAYRYNDRGVANMFL